MTVIPVRWSAPLTPSLYRSGDVYTSIGGRQVFVGTGYEGATVGVVLKQAVANAIVARWRAELTGRFSVKGLY